MSERSGKGAAVKESIPERAPNTSRKNTAATIAKCPRANAIIAFALKSKANAVHWKRDEKELERREGAEKEAAVKNANEEEKEEGTRTAEDGKVYRCAPKEISGVATSVEYKAQTVAIMTRYEKRAVHRLRVSIKARHTAEIIHQS
jgi:hypothetical protein